MRNFGRFLALLKTLRLFCTLCSKMDHLIVSTGVTARMLLPISGCHIKFSREKYSTLRQCSLFRNYFVADIHQAQDFLKAAAA